VASADASPGTLVAGDASYVRTLAPTYSSTDLDDAIEAIRVNSVEFSLLFFVGPFSAALAELRVEGVATTIPLHRAIAEHPAFVEGRYDTTFLQKYPEVLERARALASR
jgi:hypothetical protein